MPAGLRTFRNAAAAAARTVSVAVALAAGVTAAGCADTASRQSCEALLDHLIDVEVAAGATGKLSPERQADLKKQKEEVSAYLREEFVKKCQAETPGAVVRCGLKATTPDELARCDKP